MTTKESIALDRLMDQLKDMRKSLGKAFNVLRPMQQKYPSKDLEAIDRHMLKICDRLLYIYEKPLTRIVDRMGNS